MEKNKTKSMNKKAKVLCFFVISLVSIFIALSVAVVGCNYVENRNFKETFYCVSSLKVNNKIRVIQISDLHSCAYGNDNEKLIKRIEQLSPDIIILTGDCIDSHAESEEPVVKFCGALANIAPSYYIFGNNEVERYYDTNLTQEELDEKFDFNDENRDPQ